MGSGARKMVKIAINETSGVDHPAHLEEGWLVMKSADPSAVDTLLDAVAPKEGSDMTVEEQLAKAEEDLAKALATIGEMEKAAKKGVNPFAAKDGEGEPDEDDVVKSAPPEVQAFIAEMKKASDEAVAKAAAIEETLRKERTERADEVAIRKAAEEFASLGLDANEVGPALRVLEETNPDLAKSIGDALRAANGRAESADIFSEMGKASHLKGSSFDQMESMAKAAVADGTYGTKEQAIAALAVEHPDLYASYQNGKGA